MSARDALDRALAGLDSLDDDAVFISRVDPAWARAQAERIDAAPAEQVPLRGLTFAVKDNIDVETAPTTAACPTFAYRPTVSAPVVEALLEAGAVPVGKTNLDQFATGLVGVRSPYGIPRNPLDGRLVPGGSSSGSAVAVARGVVDFSLGTDTAGSGRVPAAMCGLAAVKPTRGWLSTRGVVPAVRSIDCVSVFARELDLAWRISSAAAAFDARDPMSRPAPPAPRGVAHRVGVLSPDVLSALAVDEVIGVAYGRWCGGLSALGVETIEVDPEPLLQIGQLLYGGPWVAERYAAVGAFIDTGPNGLDPTVAQIISAARRIGAVEAYDGAYRLADLGRQVEALFDAVDVLATPTVPGAPTIEQVRAEPVAANERLGLFTTFSNLADLCTAVVPIGEAPGASVSVHAPAWCDELAVEFASRSLPGSTVPPMPAQVPRGWLPLAVAGAHLKGQPLEFQLTDRGARWLGTTTTVPDYRLYALANTQPPKPGLVRADGNGVAIEVDVWAVAPDGFASFVAAIPPPLCIGTVELDGGWSVPGFLCEPRALDGAIEITHLGGWRAYRSSSR